MTRTPLPEQVGPYRVIGRLGGGGFCEVLLAKDTRHKNYGGTAVIKRLRPGLIHRDPVFLDSLLSEAEVGMMVNDRHVVRVDGVVDDGGEPAVVMEYVIGYRLDRFIRLHAGRPMPVEAATEIARQVCEGLLAIHLVHDAGSKPLWVVHQDIKPANLMVTGSGVVKILDLGMARPQREDRPALWVRQGTPGYRSPEQSRGERVLSPAADLYSVGVVLFELLQGRRLFPFASRDPDRLLERQRQVSFNMEILASKIAPPGLDQILQKLLAFEPGERYADAADVIRELEHWQLCWNSQFSFKQYLEQIAAELEALPDEQGDEPDDIHMIDTEPGIRALEVEHGVAGPTEEGVGSKMAAVIDESFEVPRPSAVPPPLPERLVAKVSRLVEAPAPGGAKNLFRRLAAIGGR